MSVRNRTKPLPRRLAEVGTTYQEALDEVRRQVACRLLAITDLDAGAVAFLLGFEELNSFTRAFSAWEGTTPSRWRASDDRQSASVTAS
jgi:AraC-like DNA-binding protein